MGTMSEDAPPRLHRAFVRMNADVVRWWLLGILVAGAAALLVVLACYGAKFADRPLSDDPERWAQFGEYLGGAAGPVLAFLTVVGLVLTLLLQVDQIEDSRNQLKASNTELKRSREIQATMAQAMSQQAHYATISARVAALGAALSVITSQVEALRLASGHDGPSKSQHDDFIAAAQKQHSLTAEIMALTDSLDEPSASATESAH